MKILITGICGFVGSTLARALLEARPGLSLIGLDNLSRPGSRINIEPLGSLGVDVRIGDITDQPLLESLPPCDWILDCAANPSVLAGTDGSSPRGLIDQNLYGTVNLLELCRKWNAGFTLISTSRVYSIRDLCAIPLRETGKRFEPTGSGTSHGPRGVTENFPTSAPVSLYGATKLCSEVLALEYAEAFGFPAWINRCGVLAGAGQFGRPDQGIFSYWLHSWKQGRPLRYIGFNATGFQVRDCLHPRDMVLLLLRQIETPEFSKLKLANLSGSNENSMSLRELSDWAEERFGPSASQAALAGSDAGLNRPYDVAWMLLDNTLAAAEWGWRPSTPLPAILEEIAQHAETHPEWLDLSNH